MLRKFLWGLVLVALVVGGAKAISDNPDKAGKDASNIVNETVEVGGGLVSGILTFLGELDF